MKPLIYEKTEFNVTENGETAIYVTDAPYEDLVKKFEYAKNLKELEEYLKEDGFVIQIKRPSIALNFDEK